MKSFLGFGDRPDLPTPTQQVRLALRSRPGVYLTKAALCELTGLSSIQVNSALYVLTKQRLITRRVPPSKATGRNTSQAYQWGGRELDEGTGAPSTPDRGGESRHRGGR